MVRHATSFSFGVFWSRNVQNIQALPNKRQKCLLFILIRIFAVSMEAIKHDISTVEDIQALVDAFYVDVRQNPVIGPIFIGAIRDAWPAHLEKMVRFWQTVIFGVPAYTGSPFPLHARMPLEERHFDAWLNLWLATVDRLFAGKNADDAKLKARNMAVMFISKLDNPFYKASGRQ